MTNTDIDVLRKKLTEQETYLQQCSRLNKEDEAAAVDFGIAAEAVTRAIAVIDSGDLSPHILNFIHS